MLSIKNIIIIVFSAFVFFTNVCTVAVANQLDSNTESLANAKFQEKLAYYLKQKKQNSSPKITYNLGVIYYKLQQYTNSKKQFFKLLSVDNYHLLAKYNLGLIAYKMGNTPLAIKWFKHISSHSHKFKTSNKVIKLANIQLAKLSKVGSSKNINLSKIKQKKKTIKSGSYIHAYYGHLDSLSDPNGSTISRDDSFLNVYGHYVFDLNDAFPKGVVLRVGYYVKDYVGSNSYDYKIASTDISNFYKIDNWRYGLRLKFDKSNYGSVDYQSILRGSIEAKYKKLHHRVLARYRYYDISADDPIYIGYEGSRQNIYLRYEWLVKAHKFRIGLDFETNDRTDNLSGMIIQNSYSATRKKLELAWYYKINKGWASRIKFEYRDSLYNNFSVADAALRDETQSSSTMQLKYRLRRHWWLVTGYRYTDNASNIADYSYTRNETRIGITGNF